MKLKMGGRTEMTDAHPPLFSKKKADAIKKVVDATWRKDRVGLGADAKNLHGYSELKIVEVECLTNSALWKKYCHRREQFLHKQTQYTIRPIEEVDQPLQTKHPDLDSSLKDEINECYLFHGTKDLAAIKNQGFDVRLAGHGNLFGQGIYFTEASAKSDQYSGEILLSYYGRDPMICVWRIVY